MLRCNRKAIFLAAVSSLGIFTAAQGQTWVNPNTSNWNLAANWNPAAVPASANTTSLFFNAIAAQTYTATNNLGTFTLNKLNFNNSGTGAINLGGDTLSFAGSAPGIVQNGSGAANVANNLELTADTTLSGTGAGTLTLAGILSTNPASDATNGPVLVKSSTGVTNLTSSGTIRGYIANAGTTNFNGSGYTLTSETIGAGSSALVVGGVAGSSVVNVLNGNNSAAYVLMGFNTAAVSTLNVSGASARLNTPGSGRFLTVGGSTTINIANGGQITTESVDLGASGTGASSLVVNGVNSQVKTAQVILGYGSTTSFSTNSVTVSNGAAFESFADFNDLSFSGSIYVGGGSQVNSSFNVLSGGTVRSDGDMYVGAAASEDGSLTNASLTVSGSGSSVTLQDGGALYTGYAVAVGSFGGNSTVSILNGGTVSASIFYGSYGAGTHSVTVDGTGSRLDIADFFAAGYDIGANQTVVVQNHGVITCLGDAGFGYVGGASGTLTVSGAGSAFTQPLSTETEPYRFFDIAGGIEANTGTLATGAVKVLNGGSFTADFFEISSYGPTVASGTLTIDGANSEFESAVAFLSLAGPNARSVVTVSNGGFADFGAVLSASADFGTLTVQAGASTINVQSGGLAFAQYINLATKLGIATVNVDGTESALLAPYGDDSEVNVGGGDGSGGNATVNITNGGAFGTVDATVSPNEYGGQVAVAVDPGSAGTINLSGADSYLGAGTFSLGGYSGVQGGTAIVNQASGVADFLVARMFAGGTYNLNGGALYSYTTQVDGRLNYNAGTADLGDLTVNGKVILNAGNNKTIQTTSLVINATGQIDLNNNGLIVDYTGASPATTIRNYIKAGRNTGAWNGTTGITSSAAAANPGKFGVGYAEVGTGSTALNISTFRGVTLADTTAIVSRETYNGDADLDGDVDSIDFGRLVAGYGLTSGGVWANGDFNYDDKVSTLDFNYLAGNFGSTPLGGPLAGSLPGDATMSLAERAALLARVELGDRELADGRMMALRDRGSSLDFLDRSALRASKFPGATPPSLGSVVPEPASLSVLGLASLALAARRRRV